MLNIYIHNMQNGFHYSNKFNKIGNDVLEIEILFTSHARKGTSYEYQQKDNVGQGV